MANSPRTTHPWLVAWAMLAGAFAPMVGLAFLVESWPYWLSVPLGCLAFVVGLVLAIIAVATFRPEWLDD